VGLSAESFTVIAMLYNIVGNDTRYQGVDRFLDLIDFNWLNRTSRKRLDIFLDLWLKAIELTGDLPQNNVNFEKLCELCQTFHRYAFYCDILVYDYVPIISAYGREIFFLGIDIEADKEYPLSNEKGELRRILNSFGLCPDIETAKCITVKWRSEYKEFDYVYVYKVVL